VDLRHVRFLAGGTGAGKSTVAQLLAERHDLTVLHGDRAEHDWLARADPDRHPRMHARTALPNAAWAALAPAEKFAATVELSGEMFACLLADLAALPAGRPVLVDWFGAMPRDLAPVLDHPGQAVFLLPAPEFRRRNLTARYADPDRARANWGDTDPAQALENRLGRDALWDAEISRQATAAGLEVTTVDGRRSPADLAGEIAGRFRLGSPGADPLAPGGGRTA
jgi:hypothetical protein